MPVTRIKIDGSFVKDILTNPRSENTVRGIVQLARDFKLDCVAEYVESAEILAKVRQLGVPKGQGYLFGKPEPLEAAIRAMEKERASAVSDFLNL
jgi:EAL domain-containing protein (putative c-di-GMP-specific phosphodiesterase class I)